MNDYNYCIEIVTISIRSHIYNVLRNGSTGESPVMIIVFNYKEKEHYSEKSLIGCLLRQLVEVSSHPKQLKFIQNLFDRHSPLPTQPTTDQLYVTLQQTLGLHPKSYFIFDGLDESHELAKLLLERLINFVGIFTAVLCTSRHPPDEQFEPADQIIIESDNSDLRLYVEERIINDTLLRKLEFRQEIVDGVVAHANRMYAFLTEVALRFANH